MAIGDGVNQSYKSALGIAEETTWATLATASAYLEFNSEGFNGEIEAKLLEQVNSERTPSKRVQGNKSVSGSVESYCYPASDAFVMLLKNLQGGTVTSTQVATTGSYGHVLATGDQQSNAGTSTASDVLGLSAQVRKGGSHVFNFLGMRVDSGTLAGSIGEPVTCSFELVGKDFTSSSALSTTVSYTTTLPVNFTGITIQNGDSLTAAATTTAVETYKSFELAVSNNLVSDERELGSRLISALPVSSQNVTLALGQRFDTTTAFDRWTGETVRSFRINLDTSETATTQSGATTNAILIELPRCYHDGSTIPQIGSRDDVLQQDLQLSCLHDTGEGYAVRFTVNNATASYE